MDENQACVVCDREFYSAEGRFPVGKPVIHHLIPKQKFRGRRFEVTTITICSRCHKQLHKLYDNYELKKNYCTLAEIKNDPEMQKFVRWIRKD
ncbi:hypothetical protein [[Eubacterium] cellulosolvens]